VLGCFAGLAVGLLVQAHCLLARDAHFHFALLEGLFQLALLGFGFLAGQPFGLLALLVFGLHQCAPFRRLLQ